MIKEERKEGGRREGKRREGGREGGERKKEGERGKGETSKGLRPEGEKFLSIFIDTRVKEWVEEFAPVSQPG